MTLENAKVLYASFIENKREEEAKDLLRRYPELDKKEEVKKELPPAVEPKKEVKKSGKRPKR